VPPMVPMLYRPRGRRYRRPGRPATAPALLPYAARLRGAHASGFVLTQGKAAGKCGTATYSLVRTAKAAQSQRSIGIIGTTGIGPDAPYDPYASPPLAETTKSLSRLLRRGPHHYLHTSARSGARVPVASSSRASRSARERGREQQGIGPTMRG
jgi:hypothetical protein